jgi:hypothetical protein
MLVPPLSARVLARSCLGLTGSLSARRDLVIRDRRPPISLREELRFVRRSRCGSPTAEGPHRVGRRQIRIERPNTTTLENAIVYYPATRDGEDAPAVAGSSFPLIGFAHGLRVHFPPCPGAPTDETQDYRQYSVVLEHIVRWGYIAVSANHSAVPFAFSMAELLEASVQHMVAENRRSGSPFEQLIREDRIVLAGHSTGGSAAFIVAANRSLNVAAIGLLAPGSDSGVASQVEAPVLVIHGTEEGAAGGARDGPYRAAGPPKHLVVVHGGNHFGFTDAVCIEEGDPPATIARSDQQRCAYGYLTAFLQKYVRGEDSNQAYLAGELPLEGLGALTISVEREV